MVARGTLRGAAAIGVRVGKVLDKYKVAKHFELAIGEASFGFTLRHDKVAAEAALDGLYVIRTGVEKRRMTADDAVRSYKALTGVERAFRSLKTVDLEVRPIHHRREDRVRAHIFLCMLAYYVEWHMREAWRELMFADEEQDAKRTRDPVAPARRSKAALKKIASRTAPRRHAPSLLPHAPRRTRHHRPQHLPHSRRRHQPHLRYPDHPQLPPATRCRTHRRHRPVVRNQTARNPAKHCRHFRRSRKRPRARRLAAAEDFPDLTREDVLACLACAAARERGTVQLHARDYCSTRITVTSW